MSSAFLHFPKSTPEVRTSEALTSDATAAPAPTVQTGKHMTLWLRLGEWALLSCLPLLITLALKTTLMRWWTDVVTGWSALMELPMAAFAMGARDSRMWATPLDGTFLPSGQALAWTCLGLVGLWVFTHLLSDRLHPVKVIIRGLCLIQASACIFFMVSPARFPYTLTQHVQSLLEMGYGLMLATGPMLALGWGILTPSPLPKIIAPLGVLAYFTLMLPHKVLLHVWLLTHASVLFMPVLFLSFGLLFDLWIFIALYAWLVSRIPAPQPAIGDRP
jgi:hypothetical protein